MAGLGTCVMKRYFDATARTAFGFVLANGEQRTCGAARLLAALLLALQCAHRYAQERGELRLRQPGALAGFDDRRRNPPPPGLSSILARTAAARLQDPAWLMPRIFA